MYFGNYTRVVYIAQTHNPELVAMASKPQPPGPGYEFRFTGMNPFSHELVQPPVSIDGRYELVPRRRTAQIITIYWRDIPSQVNGMAGRETPDPAETPVRESDRSGRDAGRHHNRQRLRQLSGAARQHRAAKTSPQAAKNWPRSSTSEFTLNA